MSTEEAISICKAIKKNVKYNSTFDLNILKLNRNNEEAIETILQALEKTTKENTDLKELYIRTAKHLDKKGHFELAEYMLAQIEATPTFTTWEEYTTWISKDKIRETIKELEKQYEEALEENSTKAFILKCQIEILKELLEGK